MVLRCGGPRGRQPSYRCSCWLQGHPQVPPSHVGLSWQSQHGGFTRAGPRVGCALLVLSQPLHVPCSHGRECCHCLLPPCQHGFTSSCQMVFFCFFSSKPTCFSRDSICNVWRRFCLKLGSVLQSRAEFTTTHLFPKLCSGI